MPKELLPIIENDQLSDDEKISQLEEALAEGASWGKEDAETHEVGIHEFIKKANAILFEWLYQRYLKQDKALFEHQDSNKNTLLHSALENDNEIISLRLLESGINFQVLDYQGFYPIHKAAKRGYLKVVEFLYHHGADINQISSNFWAYTPLIMACDNKQTRLAIKLIQWGAEINRCCKRRRMYPLHYAAQNGLDKVIQALIERNVDINKLTKDKDKKDKKSALYIACENKQKKVALKLIRLGANFRISVGWDNTYPLHVAIEEQMPEVIDAILAKETNLNQKTANSSALLLALEYADKKTALRLINNGVNIQVRSISDGYTPLGLAVKNNFIQIVKELLKRGVDVNESANSLGHIPLIIACEYGALDSLKLLLQCKPQLNIMDETGLTVMHVAATAGHIDILKILFEKKLYLNWHTIVKNKQVKKTTKFITPVSIAIETLRVDLLNFLLKQEPILQKQFAKLGWNMPRFLQQKMTREYYCYGTSHNRDKYDNDFDRGVVTSQALPIHLLAFSTYAARTTFNPYRERLEGYNYKNEIEDFDAVLNIFLKQGININSVTADKHKESLLHLVCEIVTYNYDDGIILPLERFKSVVEHGGDPCLKDAYGNTPLVYYYDHYGDYYKPDTKPFDFLMTQGFHIHEAFNLKQRHINVVNDSNAKLWHKLILNYVPRDYVKLCQGTKVSKKNYGGLLGRKITTKNFERYKEVKKYFLALGVIFEKDEMEDIEGYLNFSKWAITEVVQLATIALSTGEITLYLQVLGAYLMVSEAVEDELFNMIGDAFVCLVKRILSHKELTLEHLKAIKCVLENAKNLADEFETELRSLYLQAYHQLFDQLPSLGFFALDKLLLSSIKPVKNDFTAEQSVMDEQYKNYPLKTYFVQTGYHRLSLLFHGSQVTNEQAISMHKNLKRTAPKSEEEDKRPKKRQKPFLRFT